MRTRTCDAVPETKRAARDWRHCGSILLPGIYCQHGMAAFMNVRAIIAAFARPALVRKSRTKSEFPCF
ncbi:MAG: hypothetical protein J0G95_06075 [Rhizobiales bacterium]|nr:hypothetical protein [Hyphomicrobiales bacterium]